MSDIKFSVCGLAIATIMSVSPANSATGNSKTPTITRDFNSAYDVTGYAHQPTGRFADLAYEAAGEVPGGSPMAPLAIVNPVPGSLLLESTLSRQLYIANSTSATTCKNYSTYTWPSYMEVFNATITPQNLASGTNLIEINFNSQVSITSNASSDGLALTCLVSQGGDSVPCSNTANGPVLLRNGTAAERNKLTFVSYQGYAQVDNTSPVTVVIGLSRVTGFASGNACFSTLVLRTR
jgi:hypothetical protein